MPIDLIEFRTALAGAIADQLGTHIFANGSQTPAVRIEDGSRQYAEEPSVQGMELVIRVSPEIPMVEQFGGYRVTYQYLVSLAQWDTAQTTLGARSHIRSAIKSFPSLRITRLVRVPRREDMDIIETLNFTVIEEEFEAEDED